MLTLSQREIDRASVLRYVRDKTITARHGADLARLRGMPRLSS